MECLTLSLQLLSLQLLSLQLLSLPLSSSSIWLQLLPSNKVSILPCGNGNAVLYSSAKDGIELPRVDEKIGGSDVVGSEEEEEETIDVDEEASEEVFNLFEATLEAALLEA